MEPMARALVADLKYACLRSFPDAQLHAVVASMDACLPEYWCGQRSLRCALDRDQEKEQ